MAVVAVFLLCACVLLVLGRASTLAAWRHDRIATRRWTTLHRQLDGALAGLGVCVVAPLGAVMMIAILGLPLIALWRRFGRSTPTNGPWAAEEVVVLVAATLGALVASAALGNACLRPWWRGVVCGVGVLAFAATSGAATWSSPLTGTTLDRWVAVSLAFAAAASLGGAALLASEPPEEA